MLPGKTLCKLLQIFPPKVLVYIRNIFLNNFFDTNKMICWVWNFFDLLSVYWRTIKVETETEYLTLLTCLLIVDDNTRRKRITKFSFYWQSIYLKKKKIGACVFWAPYFSKFFGGKIHHIWTDVTYRINNTWRMRPLTAHICLSFLTRRSPWNNNFPLLDRDLAVCSSDSKSGTSVLYLCMNRVLYLDRREIRDIHLSVCKKKKNESKWKIINHKLTYGKNIIKFIFSGDNNLKLFVAEKNY